LTALVTALADRYRIEREVAKAGWLAGPSLKRRLGYCR
jgi:hypothetical protein